MTDVNDEIAGLFAIVEEIRTGKYPELDPGVVSQILGIQRQFVEDRAEARKRTEQAISQWAAAQPVPKGTT